MANPISTRQQLDEELATIHEAWEDSDQQDGLDQLHIAEALESLGTRCTTPELLKVIRAAQDRFDERCEQLNNSTGGW